MQSTSIVNTEALGSQIYNPTIDKSSLALIQVMQDHPVVPAPVRTVTPLIDSSTVPVELQPHVDSFQSLSIFNPYQGIIVNPTTCLTDPVRTDLSDTLNQMNDVFSGYTEWTDYTGEYTSDQTNINASLDQIADHTDRLTSNLPSLAGIAQGALALATVMNLLSNPCLGLDGLLGSIMDSGKKILNDIKNQVSSMAMQVKALADQVRTGVLSVVADIKAQLGPLIQDMKDAISVAKTAISGFIDKAKAEVMAFAKAILGQIRQGLAELLANLPKDPCLRSLLGSVATGAAAGIIGG